MLAEAPSIVVGPQPRRILTPKDAIPLLLDLQRSPIVSLDTEFGERGKDVPACRARLNGLSLGGGTPQTGFFATFFPFDNSPNAMPWADLRDRVLIPIISDPNRGLIEHPLKVDMQVVRQPERGIPRDAWKCRLFCTMSLVHIFDENLPKGLKELGDCLLGVNDLASYRQVQREMDRIKKDGTKTVKAEIKEALAVYKEFRAKSDKAAVPIDRSWPLWKQLAMALPSNKLLPRDQRLKVRDVAARLEPKLSELVLGVAQRKAAERFALYGAEDALITIELFYYLATRLPVDLWSFVDFERQVCHPIVTEMEETGLKIDLPRLAAIRVAMEKALEVVRVDVIARWGFNPATGEKTDLGTDDADIEFNPASNDQIAHIVWNVWKLRPPPFTTRNGQLQPKFRRAKDGLCVFDKEIRAFLAENAPEPYATNIRLIGELGRLEKLKSTFVIPLMDAAQDDPDQRCHAAFWPVGARSNRFSSSNPNAENIPRAYTMPIIPIPENADYTKPPPGIVTGAEKDKRGGEKKIWRVESLRRVFIAEPNPVLWTPPRLRLPPEPNMLAVADLAQIENRFIAHESQDPALLELFRRWDCFECKGSGHTVEPLHKCPKCGAPDGKRDKAKPDQPPIKGFCLGKDIHSHSGYCLGFFEKYGAAVGRERAKTFNHAVSYGMGANTLSRREGIEPEEAQKMLDIMHATYPGIQRLTWRVRQEIERTGAVKLFSGHVRHFPIQKLLRDSGNFFDWEWEGTVREGVNVLAQGGTGILMKRAMIRLYARLQTEEDLLGVRILSQVHDELVLEGPKSRIKAALAAMVWELEHATPELSVPVIAEGRTGTNWAEAK